uniref:Phosphatase and actin regulator n=1 Tax=Amphilophus citrinellus TaxID=61819 RepID=A0A3Q0SHJ3_AMPCI
LQALKGSAAFHEQRRSLERARTEDYLKRKIRSRPEKSELIRMHILEEPSAEPFLQAKQLQLKRVRLADDLNDRIAHRPGPMELIHKNILPVHSSIKQAFIGNQCLCIQYVTCIRGGSVVQCGSVYSGRRCNRSVIMLG